MSDNRLALSANPVSDTGNEIIILLKKESFFSSDPSIWQIENQDSSIQARITNISLYISGKKQTSYMNSTEK